MTMYTVLGSYDVRFTVEAESADDAEERVSQGEAGNGQIEGYSTLAVTSKYEHDRWFWSDYTDERSYCSCGHLMDQHFSTGTVGADDGTRVPVQPCHSGGCGCLMPTLRTTAGSAPVEDEPGVRTVELPAEDVIR